MNVSASTNSYYIDKSSGATVRLITAGKQTQDLLPERTPQEFFLRGSGRAVSGGSRTVNAKVSGQTKVILKRPAAERIVYELDGVEINPVDILFQKPPMTKEEKFKEFMKEKRKLAKVKFMKFKEQNERIAAQNDANPLEFDVSFRKTLSGLKHAAKENKQQRTRKIQSCPATDYNHISVTKRNQKKRPSPANNRNHSSSFNPFPSSTAAVDHPENSKEDPTQLPEPTEPPIAASSITKAIWNCINYYWDVSKNPQDTAKDQNLDIVDTRPVVRKVYKRQKNGLLVLVDSAEAKIDSRRTTTNKTQPSEHQRSETSSHPSVPTEKSSSIWNIFKLGLFTY